MQFWCTLGIHITKPNLMSRLYSYVLRYDDGAAPNPFWGACTLTICKPAIRRTAQPGHWIVGMGSKKVRLEDGSDVDFSGSIVYAMKVTQRMSLREYDAHCRQFLASKIPVWTSREWPLRVGDCIYDYARGDRPGLRDSVHPESQRDRDLRGENALLSDHFYYFGLQAQPLPEKLKEIVWQGQGHRVCEDAGLIEKFENWIGKFELNKIYGDPQLRYWFDNASDEEIRSACTKRDDNDDEDQESVDADASKKGRC